MRPRALSEKQAQEEATRILNEHKYHVRHVPVDIRRVLTYVARSVSAPAVAERDG